MSIVGLALAFGVGITLGLVGGGGSILTNPILVYALGVSPQAAIVMGYPIVGGAALIGAAQHWRAGTIAPRTTVPVGLAAMLGAWLGTQLVFTLGIDGQVRFALLSVTMVLAGFAMLYDARRQVPPTPRAAPRWPALLAIGVGVGALTGLVGVGGGFIMVPALIVLGGLELRRAVGTSLLVIAMSTAASFAAQRGSSDVDWSVVVRFAASMAVGILVGSSVVERVPPRALKQAFAATLVIVGALIMYQYLTI
jgi:uncharacterized membrane protein YfcA